MLVFGGLGKATNKQIAENNGHVLQTMHYRFVYNVATELHGNYQCGKLRRREGGGTSRLNLVQ